MIINGDTLLMESPIERMAPCKYSEHGVTYGLGEAGYDIRIKQQVEFLWNSATQKRDVLVDGHHAGFGRFTLASAIERFQMPDSLVGIVHDKSSWARRGLSVFNTVIEPGWEGFLTLELVYHGEEDLIIPAGAGIAQVLFHRVTDPVRYSGRYQNQEDRPTTAIHAE